MGGVYPEPGSKKVSFTYEYYRVVGLVLPVYVNDLETEHKGSVDKISRDSKKDSQRYPSRGLCCIKTHHLSIFRHKNKCISIFFALTKVLMTT